MDRASIIKKIQEDIKESTAAYKIKSIQHLHDMYQSGNLNAPLIDLDNSADLKYITRSDAIYGAMATVPDRSRISDSHDPMTRERSDQTRLSRQKSATMNQQIPCQCTFGKTCQFSHARITSVSYNQFPPCKFGNNCTFGRTCKFSHPKSIQLCRFGSQCTFGKTCKYAHP